jgi:hypothetical protein
MKDTLARNVQGLLEWHNHVCRARDEGSDNNGGEVNNINRNPCPLLLWRETLPQHFATVSGEFSSALRGKVSACECIPLRVRVVVSSLSTLHVLYFNHASLLSMLSSS